MQKKKLISAALAAALLAGSAQAGYAKPICHPVGGGSSTAVAPWIVIGCAGGVVLAALAANYRDGRELTAPEAWSCGTLFLFSRPRGG